MSTFNSAAEARAKLGLGAAASLAVGTTAGTVAAGDDSRILGAVGQADVVGGTRTAYKSADEPITTNQTPQDDDHLTLAVAAHGVYSVEACLEVTADPAGDIVMTFAAPANSGGGWTPVGVTLSTTDGTGSIRLTKFAFGTTSSMGVTAAGLFILPQGNLVVGDTAGSLTLQWAQASSNATATTIKAGSWLRMRRLG